MKELTQPRYLVIAEDTSGNWKKDNIIELAENYPFSGFTIEVKGNMYGSEMFAKYTHLFRLLHWWEFRDEKEMPEYVKHQDKIYKVTGWRGNSPYYEGGKHPFAPEVVTPATLNEYNEYIKNK